MTNRFPCLCLTALLLMSTLSVQAGIVVITGLDSPVQTLSKQQVSDLYLGRLRSVVPGKLTQVFDHPRESDLRKMFFESMLNGTPIRQVNAYWARLQFSGEVHPPKALANSQAMIDAITRDPLAIGYVDTSQVATHSVRILLRLSN